MVVTRNDQIIIAEVLVLVLSRGPFQNLSFLLPKSNEHQSPINVLRETQEAWFVCGPDDDYDYDDYDYYDDFDYEDYDHFDDYDDYE